MNQLKDQTNSSKEIYHSIIRKKFIWLLLTLVLLFLFFMLDVLIGPSWLSVNEVLNAIFSSSYQENTKNDIIVNVIRLPTATMALVVGASLGTAGAQMQTVLSNPLASPYTLGVSAAASFGAAVAIVICNDLLPIDEIIIIPFCAFIASLISSLALFLISKTKSVSIHMIILTGVALSFLFNSLLSLIQYFSKDNQFEAIVLWMFGSLQNATWIKVIIVAVVLSICLPLFLADAWKLMALQMGDEKAKSMGIQTEKLRLQVIVTASILTAVSVCFVGAIGFVGLVAPHIARTLVGEDQRFFLPSSALLGALMLSFASIVSKTIVPGAIFPVGITTSLIGIPFLLSIILKKRKRLY
ncbi:FecCD family ABC transporter permease [Chondrinema litorale]|uniref:FecCD family ABC transporter permease n=1 Tax=Chondrinema litorale TaxID=2994555 RepID=UPI0025437200|nr:iron ABC transporter permease [Chondrinema litorale]UZR96578.1 iron ABC transporter permease [Chondrinema litorale]